MELAYHIIDQGECSLFTVPLKTERKGVCYDIHSRIRILDGQWGKAEFFVIHDGREIVLARATGLKLKGTPDDEDEYVFRDLSASAQIVIAYARP